jgi:hypothetical protein
MIWRDQKRHPQRHVASVRMPASLSRVQFAYVKAYGHRSTEGIRSLLDKALDGCDRHILSTDGRLCPSVVYPGVLLTAAQTQTLLEQTSLPSDQVKSCGFSPHHSFVFYDAADRPVTSIRVCFDCGEWELGDGSKGAFPKGTRAVLGDLCRDLKLPLCPSPEDGVEEEATPDGDPYDDWLRSGDPDRPSKLFSIPETTLLSELTDVHKRQLCAWRILETNSRAYRNEDPRLSFETQDFSTCVATFPSCDVPLRNVEGLNLYFHYRSGYTTTDACIERALSSSVSHCYWGLQIPPNVRLDEP